MYIHVLRVYIHIYIYTYTYTHSKLAHYDTTIEYNAMTYNMHSILKRTQDLLQKQREKQATLQRRREELEALRKHEAWQRLETQRPSAAVAKENVSGRREEAAWLQATRREEAGAAKREAQREAAAAGSSVRPDDARSAGKPPGQDGRREASRAQASGGGDTMSPARTRAGADSKGPPPDRKGKADEELAGMLSDASCEDALTPKADGPPRWKRWMVPVLLLMMLLLILGLWEPVAALTQAPAAAPTQAPAAPQWMILLRAPPQASQASQLGSGHASGVPRPAAPPPRPAAPPLHRDPELEHVVAGILALEPQFGPRMASVGAFGADGTGSRDSLPAFRKAFASILPEGGVVAVPAGQYFLKGPLVLQSKTVLELATGSKLVFSHRAQDYPTVHTYTIL